MTSKISLNTNVQNVTINSPAERDVLMYSGGIWYPDKVNWEDLEGTPTISGGGELTILDEGNSLGTFQKLDFIGESVTVIASGDTAVITISGSTSSGIDTSDFMTKSVYDTNNNGVVDLAESVPWSGITGVPETFTPELHASTHENGGSDEISVSGLSGRLADAQNADSLVGYTVLDTVPTVGDSLIYSESGWTSSDEITTAITDRITAWQIAMKDPTGFINNTDSSIAFTDNDRTFTISPTASAFSFYSAGNLYTKEEVSTQISTDAALHYIYFTTSGVLEDSITAWDIESANVPVACVYWNGASGILMNERHGMQMDGKTHEYLHETRGPAFAFGFSGTFASDGTTVTIGAGEWYDDDLEYEPEQQTTCKMLWKSGDIWNWSEPQNAYYYSISSIPQYNNSGTLSDVDNNRFSISWIFITNHATTPVISIMGQAQYTTQAAAEAASISDVPLGDLPAAEMLLLYKIVWQRSGTAIVFKSSADYRRLSGGPVSNYVATDHGALAGLTDVDHPASAIYVITSGFYNNLAAVTGNTAQDMFNRLDALEFPSHTHQFQTLVGIADDVMSADIGDVLQYGEGGEWAAQPLPPYEVDLSKVEGRLTVASGVAVSSSDVTDATVLYFVPYMGNRIALYTNSEWKLYTFSDLSLSFVGASADTNYDIFIFDYNGEPTLDYTAWTNATTRSTLLVSQDGIYVKDDYPNYRYLGTVRTDSAGKLQDSETQRFVWNFYNQVHKNLYKAVTTSHTYNATTERAWNNDTQWKFEMVLGLASLVSITVLGYTTTTTGTVTRVTVGLDGVFPGDRHYGVAGLGMASGGALSGDGGADIVSEGYRYFVCGEAASTTGTNTFIAAYLRGVILG